MGPKTRRGVGVKKRRGIFLIGLIVMLAYAACGQAQGLDQLSYQDCGAFQYGLAQVMTEQNGERLYGLIDSEGNIKTPLDYLEINPMVNEFIRVLKKTPQGERYGYLDITGAVAIDCTYEEAYDMMGGYAVVGNQVDGRMKYGLIDSRGNQIIPPKYDDLGDYCDGLLRFGQLDEQGSMKYGYIDITDTVRIEAAYATATDFANERALVSGDEHGQTLQMIDTQGQTVMRDLPYADAATGVYDHFILVANYYEEEMNLGIIDYSGHEIVPAIYSHLEFAGEGFVTANQLEDGTISTLVFDFDGEERYFPGGYTHVGNYSEGMLLAFVGDEESGEGVYSYLDSWGDLAIPGEFDWAQPFSDGLAVVGQRQADGSYLYGYIDQSGSLVIPYQYQQARSYAEGLMAVMENGTWRYISY